MRLGKDMDLSVEILSKYNALFENLPQQGKGSLKFGRSMVTVSAISGQYYCEKKLELEGKYPLPPTERMQTGTAGHEAATAFAEPVSKEEGMALAVEEREEALPLFEFNIGWKHNDIPIIGKVDEAWFRNGNIDLVVERKFSNTLKAYRSYHIQAQLYCMGLGEMGFTTDPTAYRIVIFKRSCYDCEKLVDRSCPIFTVTNADFQCNTGEVKALIYFYKKEEIVSDLEWALGFWLGTREAIPTGIRAKCRACDYKSICESSMVK
ncbi:hypothetical protein ACFLUJ_09065 [Chloroflexota bacterium]